MTTVKRQVQPARAREEVWVREAECRSSSLEVATAT